MAMTRPFDSEKYLREQGACIVERAQQFGGRLYLEFGGKLVCDFHAARVLPGFDPNAKVRLLQTLRDQAEIVLCIHSGDIERKKMRADFGVTYDVDALRLIDDLRERDLAVVGVVFTRYEDQPSVRQFRNRLERGGLRTYVHRATPGYPTDVDTIVSDEGCGAHPFVETSRPIVVVTGPGPGSGKMATCLSQIYHERCRGNLCGYAKFETFPIWNLPMKHPVNLAYEAATADLGDVNVLDSYHLEAYGCAAVSYNRDMEIFPVLQRILEKIYEHASPYRSPTDMGVNRAGFAIADDVAVREAAVQEVIRRHLRARCEYVLGAAEQNAVRRTELLMKEMGVEREHRREVPAARAAARSARRKGKGHDDIYCGAAMTLANGVLATGCNSPLLHAASSLILNAIKIHAGIPDPLHILAPNVLASIANLKSGIFNGKTPSLDLHETLIALSVSATMNPSAQMAMNALKKLRGCEMHLTHIPTPGDEAGLRRLGINVTSEPDFAGKHLFFE
jgi:uncharacterized protein (UPF0371 family)